MEFDLQHEDLLIKLRAKLNEDKIRLWEPPFCQADQSVTQNLQDLAKKLAIELSKSYDTVLSALLELQTHSMDRSKANAEFLETGVATLRVKATVPGVGPQTVNIQKKLDVQGSELIGAVAAALDVCDSRVKLIFNGKVIKPTPSMEEQGIKNGVQIMALVMAETPDAVKKEDQMYMEMKTTRDDATLLSEYVDDFDNDDEYMQLEDQSGRCVELPAAERRALLVGLALHGRGRAALKQHDYPLALVLLLEADKQFSDCSSSLLGQTDNSAVLQLDIAWCYVCLRALQHAADAARRLRRAEDAFRAAYGEHRHRLKALKGENANERVLYMRLYLLQGIVAYHQNQRAEARALLEKAELELNSLKVDETSLQLLMELGWSRGEARAGLRAADGDVERAHQCLEARRVEKGQARERRRLARQQRSLGTCVDGTPVSARLVSALAGAGFGRRLAARALRNANNHAGDAVRLIQDHRDLLVSSDEGSEEDETPSSDDSTLEPDEKLVAELAAMGYEVEQARKALKLARNHPSGAVELLVAGGGYVNEDATVDNPSTSAGGSKKRKGKKHQKNKMKRECDEALRRLTSHIRGDGEDHLDTSLSREEDFLAQYKSLL